MWRLVAALAAVMLFALPSAAQDKPLTPEQKAEIQRLIKLRDSLHPQHGAIALASAKARLNLGSGYYFLGPADAKRVLTEGWGNPPEAADGVLGLVFPEGKTFLDETWGAVITYEPVGYVKDKDARSEDYAKVLEDMRSGEDEGNEQRKKDGYEPIHLVGWAQAPSYDPARHDLIWARELQFGQQTDHSLNYDVRHLGRDGVLSLNMVSVMSQLPAVRQGALDLAKTAEFDTGARYADFTEGDKVAGFGLAGLIAAGAGLAVAKKVGLIGIILLFAKKFIAIIVAAAAGGAAWLLRLFGAKSRTLDIRTAPAAGPDAEPPAPPA